MTGNLTLAPASTQAARYFVTSLLHASTIFSSPICLRSSHLFPERPSSFSA